MLVKFRVDRPHTLSSVNEVFVRHLAAKHLATSGKGTSRDLDGIEQASYSDRAKEQSSQFVFLKLFKDFPVDEIELSRPFVGPVMKNRDLAVIVAFAVVGILLRCDFYGRTLVSY